MASNKNFHTAKRAKFDEFYTRDKDIQDELKNYEKEFRKKIKDKDGKERGVIVLCNCDDPIESEFVKYFAAKFDTFKLHSLIATSYKNSPISKDRLPYKAIIRGNIVFTEEGKPNLEETFNQEGNEKKTLEGDGDFRSDECIELLKQADIVVTNPPFSLFREYVSLLMKYEKKFLIIGNQNAITYRDFFPLLKDNKVWVGNKAIGTDTYFEVPEKYKKWLVENKKEGSGYKIIKGNILGRVNICWYTNLDLKKRHNEMKLFRRYNSNDYQKFDNYDAISVNKIEDIPIDFEGVMGVPITFIDKYNPKQFEILGITDRNNPYGLTTKIYTPEDGKNYGDLNRRAAIRMPDNSLKCTYARLLIRNLHPEPRPSTQPAVDSTSADLSDSMPASAPIISCAEDCSFQLRTMDRFNAMVAVTEGATVQPQLPLAYADGEPMAEPQTEPTAETERPEDALCLQPA